MIRRSLVLAFAVAVAMGVAKEAAALTVDARNSIYKAGGGAGDGLAPLAVAVLPGQIITFTSVSGTVNCCSGQASYNAGPDGSTTFSTNIAAANGISGISASTSMFLAGVFGTASGPGTGPGALNFTSGGIGTDFASLAPSLWQSFFIGNGRRLDGTTLQTFVAPAAATFLYLGFVDGLGFGGAPGSYSDNTGSFSVELSQSAVPLPGTLPLFAAGIGALGLVGLRRKARAPV